MAEALRYGDKAPDPKVCIELAEGLSHSLDPRALQQMLLAREDLPPWVRALAAYALRMLRSEQGDRLLMEAYDRLPGSRLKGSVLAAWLSAFGDEVLKHKDNSVAHLLNPDPLISAETNVRRIRSYTMAEWGLRAYLRHQGKESEEILWVGEERERLYDALCDSQRQVEEVSMLFRNAAVDTTLASMDRVFMVTALGDSRSAWASEFLAQTAVHEPDKRVAMMAAMSLGSCDTPGVVTWASWVLQTREYDKKAGIHNAIISGLTFNGSDAAKAPIDAFLLELAGSPGPLQWEAMAGLGRRTSAETYNGILAHIESGDPERARRAFYAFLGRKGIPPADVERVKRILDAMLPADSETDQEERHHMRSSLDDAEWLARHVSK